MAANTTVGTTPEVLQHYLTAGIGLQTPDGAGELSGLRLTRWTPTGKLSRDFRPVVAAHFEDPEYRVGYFNLEECLPILRPFPALTEPLEDGTVPAVEVAKKALGGEADEINWAEVEVRPTNADSTQAIDIVDTSDGLYHWVLVSISNTFDTDCDGNFTVNHAAVTDYLRSQHFALPVDGRPLLEGVDYIPKTSSAAPIDKNTAL